MVIWGRGKGLAGLELRASQSAVLEHSRFEYYYLIICTL